MPPRRGQEPDLQKATSELTQLVVKHGYMAVRDKANRLLAVLAQSTKGESGVRNDEIYDVMMNPSVRMVMLEI